MDLKDIKKIIMLPMITGQFYSYFSVDKLKLNYLLLSYGLLLRVLFFILYCLSVILRNEPQEAEGRLYKTSESINTFLHFLSSITSYISVILNMKKFNCAINISNTVDKQFSIHDIVKLHGLMWPFHLLNLLLGAGSLIVAYLHLMGTGFKRFVMGLLYLYMLISFYMSVYLFMTMVDRVRTQFRALREFLKTTSSHTQMGSKLVVAVRLHSLLSQTCKHLNNCFNWQLLLLYLVIFSMVVSNSYYFIVIIEKKKIWLLLYAIASIILFYSSTGYLVVYLCKRASLEARKFNTMLYQLMLDDKIGEISTNIKLRLHLSMKREVVFTACGFFTLDNTLIHSLTAATATYLVILVQFGEAELNPE